MRKASVELEQWHEAKRQCSLSDAQVQMARELGMKPKRLIAAGTTAQGTTPMPLAQRIENLYLGRFKKPLPDTVVPLRQLLHDARARERAEAHEQRRRKRQAEKDHAEAARISLLTLHRLCNAIGLGRAGIPHVEDDYDSRPTNAAK
ncbi:MAG TPA: hypothetical protein VMH22_04270 [bacterium]|nr:hypothetical protein [bacterium]HUN81618.1 hypothetical protein [Phycisphaerae bacterium]